MEVRRYPLTKADSMVFSPYVKGDQIHFVHSGGLDFDFKVSQDDQGWAEYSRHCVECCASDYVSYQTKRVMLESEYPRFQIELSKGNSFYPDYPYEDMDTLSYLIIGINQSSYSVIGYDSLGILRAGADQIFYDSIIVNSRTFYDVVESPINYSYRIVRDSTGLDFESLLHSHLGLLQIKLTNGESYSMDN